MIGPLLLPAGDMPVSHLLANDAPILSFHERLVMVDMFREM